MSLNGDILGYVTALHYNIGRYKRCIFV